MNPIRSGASNGVIMNKMNNKILRSTILIILTIILLSFLISPTLVSAEKYTRVLRYKNNGTTISSSCNGSNGVYNCTCQGSNHVDNCHLGRIITDPICACCGDCTLYDALEIGSNAVGIILKYLGVIAFALFIYGGIIWLTSGGSQEQFEKGKKIIIGTLIGLLIILAAYLIIQTILKWVAPSYQLSLKKESNYNLLATDNFNKVIKYYDEKIL